MKDSSLIPVEQIEKAIYSIRGERVMLDFDLAALYQVTTKALNQAVRRHRERFPLDFMFQLTTDEALSVRSRSQSVTLKRGQNVKYAPFAFTEHGALMAANILNSPQASHEVRQHEEGVVERSGTARCVSCG